MKVRRLTAALMAGALAAGAVGCGGSAGTEGGNGGSSDNTVTIWATGSANVRQIYGTLGEDFNTNYE